MSKSLIIIREYSQALAGSHGNSYAWLIMHIIWIQYFNLCSALHALLDFFEKLMAYINRNVSPLICCCSLKHFSNFLGLHYDCNQWQILWQFGNWSIWSSFQQQITCNDSLWTQPLLHVPITTVRHFPHQCGGLFLLPWRLRSRWIHWLFQFK